MSSANPRGVDPNDEITALIEVLHNAEQRLEELTAGEVDTVSNQAGQTILLRRAQESLRLREALGRAAILSALPAHIALLDAQGVIVTVNEAWQQFASDNALQRAGTSVGTNYLSVCDQARGEGAADAQLAAAGIRAVLAGTAQSFSIEYACHSAIEERWFLFKATPLSQDSSNGAVIMHVNVTGEREAQERVRISESRFRQMAENIRDVFFLRSIDNSRIYYVSPAYEEIWGRSCESLYANPASWSESTHPEDLADSQWTLTRDQDAGTDCEYRVIRPDHGTRWVQVRTFPIRDEAGKPYRTAGVATDITARKAAEQKIKRLNRVYAVLSGISSLIVRVTARDELFREACRIAVEVGAFKMAWIAVVDSVTHEGSVAAWCGGNESYVRKITLTAQPGGSDSQLPAWRALRQMVPVFCNDVTKDPAVASLREEFLSRGHRALGCLPLTIAGKPEAVLVLTSGEPNVFDAEETQLLLELAGDISFALDHLQKADQLAYVAYYDLLTGLANQRLFLERVTQYLHSATLHKHRLAVCVMDLERFKNINDTFGRAAADALLQQMTAWLKEHLGDANLLARVGPDKFAVVIPELTHEEDVVRLLEHAMDLFMNHPFQLNDSTFRVTAKVGVVLFPDDGVAADVLFGNAEAALKKAKSSGDRYLFYAQKMTETVTGRLVMEYRMRHALENNEFVLHYQPKISLATGKLTGAEALIRWNDPHKGLIPPGQFIPLLEETGLISEVGRWALHKALHDYLIWRAAGLSIPRIAVNVSPLQLRNRAFVSDVRQAIAIDEHAAEGLELEITESVIMKDIEQTIESLCEIRKMGVSIAIDDFGTGFSSLSYLSKLPVDTLKIDHSFITEMTTTPGGLSVVSTIVSLAHSLKLKVVAEGVETVEQSRLLHSLNCDEMQGFLFSRPLPRELFEERYLRADPAQSV
jgi:diguanylate cyclase (GGDEF)-like protein/PAS domain S-box-containing protein